MKIGVGMIVAGALVFAAEQAALSQQLVQGNCSPPMFAACAVWNCGLAGPGLCPEGPGGGQLPYNHAKGVTQMKGVCGAHQEFWCQTAPVVCNVTLHFSLMGQCTPENHNCSTIGADPTMQWC